MLLHYTLQCLRFSCSLKNFGFCFLSGQYNSAKKRLVQLAVLSGWHYQNKSYPEVEIGCDSSIIISFSKILCKFCFQRLCKIIKKGSLQCPSPIYCLIFFVTTTTSILNPPPPPPNSLSYIIIPKKPTYLGSMGNYLSRKAEMPTSLVDSGDCLFFTSPSPACQQSHYPTHTLPPNWPSRLRELCEVLYEVHAIKIRFHSFPETKND